MRRPERSVQPAQRVHRRSPLDPVVARTYEFGARGKLPLGDALQWSLAFFRTDVSDDILFTQTETTGAGFFQNVAKTRRQGVEVGLQGRRGSG